MTNSPSVLIAACGAALHRLGRPRWLAGLFLLCALPTGLGCALLTPIGRFPDEQMHIVRADGLRQGEVFSRRPPPGFPAMAFAAGTTINTGLLRSLFPPEPVELFPPRPETAPQRMAESTPWGGLSYFPTQMVEYAPIFYLPAAAGLLAGQELGISPFHALFLGRAAMLLAFLAVGATALAAARSGAPLLFAVLTLPVEVNLAASFNQDGLMIAACVLAASLLTRSQSAFSLSRLAALGALACVACAKTPYGGLLLFGLLPVTVRNFPRRAVFVALAAVAPALWLLHLVHFGFIDYQHPPYHPGPLWPGPRDIWLHDVQPAYNIAVLLSHPARIITLPVGSFLWLWPITWRLIIGMVGNDHGMIAAWEYPGLVLALGAAALGVTTARLARA